MNLLKRPFKIYILLSTITFVAVVMLSKPAIASSKFSTSSSEVRGNTYSPFAHEALYVHLFLNIPQAPGWKKVIYDVTHPKWPEIVQSIYDAANLIVAFDANLLLKPMTFYIFNGKRLGFPPNKISLDSEFFEPDMIHFYNSDATNFVATGPTNKNQKTLGAIAGGDTLRTTMHEFGHSKYGEMTDEAKDAWQEVWEMTIMLDLDRPTLTFTNKEGKKQRYYEYSAEEGFCEAYADNYATNQPLDVTITIFLGNLPPE